MIVPTVLVYGVWPKLPLRDDVYHSATYSERATLRLTAMDEYRKQVDAIRAKVTQECQAPAVPTDLRP